MNKLLYIANLYMIVQMLDETFRWYLNPNFSLMSRIKDILVWQVVVIMQVSDQLLDFVMGDVI
jgi:hypothetical protein